MTSARRRLSPGGRETKCCKALTSYESKEYDCGHFSNLRRTALERQSDTTVMQSAPRSEYTDSNCIWRDSRERVGNGQRLESRSSDDRGAQFPHRRSKNEGRTIVSSILSNAEQNL